MPVGSDWGNWAVTEKGIYVLRRRHDEPPWLTLSDFDGASTRELMPLDPAPSPHHPGLSISRDGRSVLVTRVDDTESDLFVMTR